jgi:RNA polymerase sigma factor (sigma-70 family)
MKCDYPQWTHLTGPDRHAACVRAARDGDRAALHALITDLTPLVWHVARGQGLRRQVAEDVVQTVWLLLLTNLDRLAEPRSVASWLITTTRRESQHAGVRVNVNVELPPELPADDPPLEYELLRTERDRTLWAAFNELPPRCQELLRLTVLAARPEYRVVAETLHMPVGSIGPTRGRCLAHLRAALERQASREQR